MGGRTGESEGTDAAAPAITRRELLDRADEIRQRREWAARHRHDPIARPPRGGFRYERDWPQPTAELDRPVHLHDVCAPGRRPDLDDPMAAAFCELAEERAEARRAAQRYLRPAPISPETIAERTGAVEDARRAETYLALHEIEQERTRLHARYLRRIAELHDIDDLPDPDDPLGREERRLEASLPLRQTTSRTATTIERAHRAVTFFPRSFELLDQGIFPMEWFERMLSRSGDLEDPVLWDRVDEKVAALDLPRLSADAFQRRLREILLLVRHPEPTPDPDARRRVLLSEPDPVAGTVDLVITAPIPEGIDLANRLDTVARRIRTEQRSALRSIAELTAQGDEHGAAAVEIPFDPDGTARRTGRPLSLATLRYLVLTQSLLQHDPVHVPPRFRVNVTVPMLTLLGEDAPGLVEGQHPIPPDLARELATGSTELYRILTDPATGRFLDADATRYTVGRGLLEHLRLRHPVCATPGCTRPTLTGAQADHIEEFDHRDPAAGGPTRLENLHLLCETHHQLKTARRIDPIRGPSPGPTGAPPTTIWRIGPVETTVEETTDLLTAGRWRSLREAQAYAERLAQRRTRAAEHATTPAHTTTPAHATIEPPPF
ncbi:HNH endonuclease [Brachybacterium sp. EF45031]|uniref:HNH endonuclease signature motif containing protein n=1 Tax=Brachybacterium sillae TaxID=2810536 RepID=UPI00217D91B5|nr:HNH endonuclease signature motif containing protein [Brachybacterium sillae]MCS6711399.1 HNH endonuclease [Brachybacterium sillae]